MAEADGGRPAAGPDREGMTGPERAMLYRLAAETGLAYLPAEAGDSVAGVYSRRLSLSSGHFAMIDNGLGFQLVPWLPSLERELGRQVSGIAGPGGVDWNFGRKRELSL